MLQKKNKLTQEVQIFSKIKSTFTKLKKKKRKNETLALHNFLPQAMFAEKQNKIKTHFTDSELLIRDKDCVTVGFVSKSEVVVLV